MIAPGVKAPTFKSVIEDQLSGESQRKTKAGTVESKVLTPSRHGTPSAISAKVEKKLVPVHVEKSKAPQRIVNLFPWSN